MVKVIHHNGAYGREFKIILEVSGDSIYYLCGIGYISSSDSPEHFSSLLTDEKITSFIKHARKLMNYRKETLSNLKDQVSKLNAHIAMIEGLEV